MQESFDQVLTRRFQSNVFKVILYAAKWKNMFKKCTLALIVFNKCQTL